MNDIESKYISLLNDKTDEYILKGLKTEEYYKKELEKA